MAIDWKNLTIDAIIADPETLVEIKAEYQAEVEAKNSLAKKKAEILDERKKIDRDLQQYRSLQAELEIEDLDTLKDLVIKGKTAGADGGDRDKAFQALKEQRELDRVQAVKDRTALLEKAALEKTELEQRELGLNSRYKQSIIRTQLAIKLSADFNLADDGIALLQREGYTFDLDGDEDSAYEDQTVKLYKKGNTDVDFALDAVVEELKAKEKFAHYFKSSFVGGTGFNGGSKSKTGEENPWAKDTWNRTKQAIISRNNPAKAAQLEKAARVKK
jgi:hypothetical protein